MTILRKFDKNFRLKKKKKINNDTSSRTTDKYCFFNGDEKEVVKILQQLPQFILESESSSYPSFLFTWGVKKRRSLTLTNNINGSQSPPPPPLSISTTFYSPSPPPLPCNCVTATISSGKSFIPSNPLSFSSSGSFSKQPTCKRKTTSNKAKKIKMKSKDTLTSSSRKQRKTFVKLLMADCNDQKFRNLELKSSPSFPDQQRDKLHSNSSRKRRRSFDLSSAGGVGGPNVFSPAPEEEEEEEEEGSLTKVADESRIGYEMNEQKSYSQIAQSLSGEVGGLVMEKHLSPLGIPDLNLGPDDNFFKSFDMNKQPPLQMC